MTDDFELFQDQAGGDPVDADIALITAYLARELSLVQIVAVEDRLATDRAFREKVAPIIDAWVMPTPLGAVVGRDTADARALTREEIEAGWQRYVGERAELDAHDGPRLMVGVEKPKRKRISMTRIAAGIAAITLPIIAFAQAVVYASKHPEAPGHAVAVQIVGPMVEVQPATQPENPEKPTPSTVDVRVGRELEKAAQTVQRAADALVPAAEPSTTEPLKIAPPPTATVRATPIVAGRAPSPDRAKIAGYASKHMPELIRGDTTAAYIVMVLDASDNYVWGTYGSGTLQILIAGDKRTAADRIANNQQNALQYQGAARAGRGGGGGGRGGAVGARPDSGRVLALGAVGGRPRGGGGTDSALMVSRDTLRRVVQSIDSLSERLRQQLDTSGGRRQVVAGSGARGGGGFVARAGVDTVQRLEALRSMVGPIGGFQPDTSRVYTIGFGRFSNGQPVSVNEAAGLQEPSETESGIQGLKATSLTMGENYMFPAGELTKQLLRVVVVHLAPGTTWKGR